MEKIEQIPTFDYLAVNTSSDMYTTFYIVKDRSINFRTSMGKSKSFVTILEEVIKYLNSTPVPAPAKKLIGKNSLVEREKERLIRPILLLIYSDSITIRSTRRLREFPTLPLRDNPNQLIKIPCADISETFQDNVNSFILEIDGLASEVPVPARP